MKEFRLTLKDMSQGAYQKNQLTNCKFNQGVYESASYIALEKVPIVTPKGDALIQELTFKIQAGHSVLI